MKILTSPSSGSIAGVTYSHGRAGQYTRSRRAPCQPVGQGRRGVARAAFGAASSAWASLLPAVQLAWGAYASAHPYTDALGQSVKLTGHQMYVAINSMLINCGKAQSSVIPVSDAVFSAQFSAFTAVHAVAITLTPSGLGGLTDTLLISMSPPQSGGRAFCKQFCQFATEPGNAITPVVLTTAYTSSFGAVSAGQRLFYSLTPVNQYGVRGTSNQGYIIVT